MPSEDQLCETISNMYTDEELDYYIPITIENGGEHILVRMRFFLHYQGRSMRIFTFCELYEGDEERKRVKVQLMNYDEYVAECEKNGVRVLSEDVLEEICISEIETFIGLDVECNGFFLDAENGFHCRMYFDCSCTEEMVYEVVFCEVETMDMLIELLGYDEMVSEWTAQGLPEKMLVSEESMKRQIFSQICDYHYLKGRPVGCFSEYFEDEEGRECFVAINLRENEYDMYEGKHHFEYAGLKVIRKTLEDKPQKKHWWQKLRRK